jgi:hypothetical protein
MATPIIKPENPKEAKLSDFFGSFFKLILWDWWRKSSPEKRTFLFNDKALPNGVAWALCLVGFFCIAFLALNIWGISTQGLGRWFRKFGDIFVASATFVISCELIYNLWAILFFWVSFGHGWSKYYRRLQANAYWWAGWRAGLAAGGIFSALVFIGFGWWEGKYLVECLTEAFVSFICMAILQTFCSIVLYLISKQLHNHNNAMYLDNLDEHLT